MTFLSRYIDWPLRQKLTFIMLITASTLMFTLILGVTVEKSSRHRKKAKADSVVLAEVIGQNSTAALAFFDTITAHEILSALAADTRILEAALYQKKGTRFSHYTNTKKRLARKDENVFGFEFDKDMMRSEVVYDAPWFTTIRDITLSGKTIGFVVLRVDLSTLNEHLRNFYIFISAFSVVLLTVMTLFCSALIKAVLKPATRLSKAMDAITENQNYDVSVQKRGNDEIGVLIDGFNEMIDGINKRDDELAAYRGDLENLVNMRTSELKTANEKLKFEIEERKAIQNKLAQAEKMEAIGTLAGGVAHDLNNILSGIVSYPDLLLMQLPNDSKLVKPIKTIRRSGKKAAAIVQDLLTLARRGVKVEEHIELKEIIEDYLNSPEFFELNRTNFDVAVDFYPTKDVFCMRGSPVHLSKTVMNLVANGVEAISGSGNVAIYLEKIFLEQASPDFVAFRKGDYIKLTVSDTGIGIAEEFQKRIFEPFFSHKVMGKSGTGLGMSVVWGTVEDHKGYIEIESELGIGTTFTLYFPAESGTKLEKVGKIKKTKLHGRGQYILVVDDSPQQRQIAADVLMHFGYKPTVLSSGEEAVTFLQKNDVDLVMLDMIMDPGINGLETYKQILQFKPDQKVIIASGYSQEETIVEARRLGIVDFVEKPYSVERIGEVLKDILG